MLGLVAAQLQLPARRPHGGKLPVWFDLGGGTGYNIEVMDKLVGVEEFFEHVYLIDLSPSLCEVARRRVEAFGWTNVTVLCQDARAVQFQSRTADLITMSYSLSMIPDFYSVVDQVTNLLAPKGVFGICDFYVQSIVDVSSRNYTGGTINRHVNWLGRMFWRTWFDADRVNLDAGRRDYVEYKFGTILSASERNYMMGGIPYYLFVGCHISAETIRHDPTSTMNSPTISAHDSLERHDATLTESPYLSPQEYRQALSTQASTPPQLTHPNGTSIVRSKSYESALINLTSNLPLPSAFYQHHPWRTTYSDLLPKHTQFASEYIYAFNWEDPAVDLNILNLQPSDVLVTITSAGDNILDYLSHSSAPLKRVHAIDLNPNQNHLLELKCACFAAQLPHRQIWNLFGDGRIEHFRSLLIHRLSPHLSSPAFQFWLSHTEIFSPTSRGLYASSGGSRHAITLCRWLFRLTRLTQKVRTICTVSTLAEQKEIWYNSLRPILLSRPLHALLISSEWWAWRAAGVPPEQRQLIVKDYEATLSPEQRNRTSHRKIAGDAIFRFLENTLDPVINTSLLSKDNYFYHVVLQGRYTKTCAPRWLGEREHRRLSRDNARLLDGLRIHTDEFLEVVKRMRWGSVGAVIVMDSMDWLEVPDLQVNKTVHFEDKNRKGSKKGDRSRSQSKSRSTEGTDAAQSQIDAIHRVLKISGKVLLRSAALKPWYIDLFERAEDDETGSKLWSVKCMGRRENGKCIDRVNMYASCWVCIKVGEVTPPASIVGSPQMRKSALKRRTASGGSAEGSYASGSDSVSNVGSPDAVRGRQMEDREEVDDEEHGKTTTMKGRRIMEDMMLPSAAIEDDADAEIESDGDRF